MRKNNKHSLGQFLMGSARMIKRRLHPRKFLALWNYYLFSVKYIPLSFRFLLKDFTKDPGELVFKGQNVPVNFRTEHTPEGNKKEDWCAYYLNCAQFYYKNNQHQNSIENFKNAVQINPTDENSWRLFYRALVIKNYHLYANIEKILRNVDLIVAHISCVKRIDLAKNSVKSFTDLDGRILNIIVVGKSTLKPYEFQFDFDRFILAVPCNDNYEALPKKIFELFLFLGGVSDNKPVFKVDDEIHCKDVEKYLKCYHRKIKNVHYGGGQVVSSALLHESTHWHLNKCEDQQLNHSPYCMLYGGAYAEGAYYWLNASCARLMSRLVILHEDYVNSELYEDRAVGAVLDRYGIAPYSLGLIDKKIFRRELSSA